MNDKKIFLVKCKREEIINRPTIEFVELTSEGLKHMKELSKEGSMINCEKCKVLLKELETVA